VKQQVQNDDGHFFENGGVQASMDSLVDLMSWFVRTSRILYNLSESSIEKSRKDLFADDEMAKSQSSLAQRNPVGSPEDANHGARDASSDETSDPMVLIEPDHSQSRGDGTLMQQHSSTLNTDELLIPIETRDNESRNMTDLALSSESKEETISKTSREARAIQDDPVPGDEILARNDLALQLKSLSEELGASKSNLESVKQELRAEKELRLDTERRNQEITQHLNIVSVERDDAVAIKDSLEEQMKELLALTESFPLEQPTNSEAPIYPLPSLETVTSESAEQKTADDNSDAARSLYQKLADNISKLHEGKLFWERQSVDIGGVLSIVSSRVVESYEREIALEQKYVETHNNCQENMREVRLQLEETNDVKEQLTVKLERYTTIFGEMEPEKIKEELDSTNHALAVNHEKTQNLKLN
jgi:hypothetical protein